MRADTERLKGLCEQTRRVLTEDEAQRISRYAQVIATVVRQRRPKVGALAGKDMQELLDELLEDPEAAAYLAQFMEARK